MKSDVEIVEIKISGYLFHIGFCFFFSQASHRNEANTDPQNGKSHVDVQNHTRINISDGCETVSACCLFFLQTPKV